MLTAASDLNQLRQQPFSILSPAILIFIFVVGIRLLSDNKKRDRDILLRSEKIANPETMPSLSIK